MYLLYARRGYKLNDNIAYLNKGISLFKARENEEKQLANIL